MFGASVLPAEARFERSLLQHTWRGTGRVKLQHVSRKHIHTVKHHVFYFTKWIRYQSGCPSVVHRNSIKLSLWFGTRESLRFRSQQTTKSCDPSRSSLVIFLLFKNQNDRKKDINMVPLGVVIGPVPVSDRASRLWFYKYRLNTQWRISAPACVQLSSF